MMEAKQLTAREQKSLDNKAAWRVAAKRKADSQEKRVGLADVASPIFHGQALADALRNKVGMALKYLDDHTMLNSTGKDLAVIIGILTEKMQLIEGKPTVMYDVTVLHRLEVMMPAFLAEAKRRGITLDVTPEQVIEELMS